MVLSISAWRYERNRSSPSMARPGPDSRKAMASATVAPGTIRSATVLISASSRCSSSHPQRYASSGSTLAPSV